MKKITYKNWTRIPWDGNPDLNLECWRKSFRNGDVSVGIGEFLNVVYSYGANSVESCCGTRWNYNNPPISEEEAMKKIDKNNGFHRSLLQ